MARRVPIEDRAAAIGVARKDPPKGKCPATTRANREYIIDREAAYLRTKPVLPPSPSRLPADTPGELIRDVSRALAFGRKIGSLPLETCALFRETRLSATYFW